MRFRERTPVQADVRPSGTARRLPFKRFALHLHPTEQRLSIVTDDPHAAAYVRLAYGDALQRGGTAHRSTHRAVLRRNARSTSSYAVDQCVWRAVAADASWRAVYGCAVALDRSGVLIMGPSGAGKTTLGLALFRTGARIYGDEISFVHRADRSVTALSRRIAVRASTLQVLRDDDLVSRIRRAGVLVHEAAGPMFLVARETLGSLPPPYPLGLIIVIRGHGAPSLEALSPARAGLELARHCGVRPESLDALGRITVEFAGVPAFALTVGEPAATAAMIRALAT